MRQPTGLQQRQHGATVGMGETQAQIVGNAHWPVAGVADTLNQYGRFVV